MYDASVSTVMTETCHNVGIAYNFSPRGIAVVFADKS